MKLNFKKSLDYPLKDISTKGVYSIDVLILYNDELYIGYYNFKDLEWRYQNKDTNTEETFYIEWENELKWTNIPTPINQR